MSARPEKLAYLFSDPNCPSLLVLLSGFIVPAVRPESPFVLLAGFIVRPACPSTPARSPIIHCPIFKLLERLVLPKFLGVGGGEATANAALIGAACPRPLQRLVVENPRLKTYAMKNSTSIERASKALCLLTNFFEEPLSVASASILPRNHPSLDSTSKHFFYFSSSDFANTHPMRITVIPRRRPYQKQTIRLALLPTIPCEEPSSACRSRYPYFKTIFFRSPPPRYPIERVLSTR